MKWMIKPHNWREIALVLIVITIIGVAALLSKPAFAEGPTVNWSTGYYVGWQQAAFPPASLPWKSITHLNHFSVMSSSARNGAVVLAHSLTPTFMQAAVAEAHKHNVKIYIAVGGAEDHNFDAACNNTNRTTFINNLISIMQTYGYDGIDLDIEQDFGSPDHTDYIACVSQLRAALNTITPRPGLTMAADPDWQAYMAVKVAQYLDQINLMSYWTNAAGMAAKMNNYTSLGIPKSKLGIGLGLGDDGGIDTTAAACDAKTAFAANNGYGGVMEWMVTDDQRLHSGQTPCLDAVAAYLPVSASPLPSASPSPSPSPILSPSPVASPNKPGDVDGNNKVDIFDYNILLTNFGKTGSGVPGDLDKNGKVDIFDYNILLTNFGK